METVNEYKIGDKVVVRKDLDEDEYYGGRCVCCIDHMVAMGGQTLTISGIDVNKYGCEYHVDENGWVWAPEMFSTGYEEEVEETEKTDETDETKCELAVGDTAKLTRDELTFKGEIKKGTMVKVLVVESDGSCLIASKKINGHSGDAYYDCHSDTCPEKYEGHCWFMDVSGLEKVEQKPAPKTKYRVGDKVIYNGVMSNHEDVEGVIIHTRVDDDGISRYTVGFDSPIAHSHDGMDNEIGIDSIEHVKKKYRHYVEDNRCIFARDRFLRLYEEPKEESKYHRGDKVVVRKDLIENKYYGDGVRCNDEMAEMGGKVLTIHDSLTGDKTSYFVEENHFVWATEMFEGLAPKFKTGDTVKITEDGDYYGCVGKVVGRDTDDTLLVASERFNGHSGEHGSVHVPEKYEGRCHWFSDSDLELYEEPKLKVGDRVCLEGVIASTGDDGSIFVRFDGEEKISPTYISPSAKFKKVEK